MHYFRVKLFCVFGGAMLGFGVILVGSGCSDGQTSSSTSEKVNSTPIAHKQLPQIQFDQPDLTALVPEWLALGLHLGENAVIVCGEYAGTGKRQDLLDASIPVQRWNVVEILLGSVYASSVETGYTVDRIFSAPHKLLHRELPAYEPGTRHLILLAGHKYLLNSGGQVSSGSLVAINTHRSVYYVDVPDTPRNRSALKDIVGWASKDDVQSQQRTVRARFDRLYSLRPMTEVVDGQVVESSSPAEREESDRLRQELLTGGSEMIPHLIFIKIYTDGQLVRGELAESLLDQLRNGR